MQTLIIDTKSWTEKFANALGKYVTESNRGGLPYLNTNFGNNGYGFIAERNDDGYEAARQHYIDYVTNNELKDVVNTLAFYKDSRSDVSYYLGRKKEIEEKIQILKDRDKSTFLPYDVQTSVIIDIPNYMNVDLKLYEDRVKEYCVENNIELVGFRYEEPLSQSKKDKTRIVSSDRTDIKVTVKEYLGRLIIETLNREDKEDSDFIGAGGGIIGCQLMNPKRLGVSEEALRILKNTGRGRDCIGDVCGDSDYFSWIGDWNTILGPKIVGSRDYKMCKDYVIIENDVSQEAIDYIDKKEKGTTIDYMDIKFEFWIEFSGHKESDNYNVTFAIHDAHFYDEKITFLNVPEDHLDQDKESTTIQSSKENFRKVADLLYHNILGEKLFIPREDDPNYVKSDFEIQWEETMRSFRKYDRTHNNPYKHSIPKEEIWDYVDSFFDLGLSNNIMHPRDDYFRLSVKSTIGDVLEKLSKFKLVESNKKI